jgi:hypothetical protein
MSQAEFDNAYKQAGKLGGGGNEDKLEVSSTLTCD